MLLLVQQLTATELSLGPAALLARHSFVGGELGLARRPASQSRIALAVAAGAEDGAAAARAQLTLQFLLGSSARSGRGAYAGLGAALRGRARAPSDGWLAFVVGVESAPGRRRGWFVELGLGGGVRVAAGWRLRRFPGWWRGG